MQLQESAAAMKKKRSISRKITRSILFIATIPIIMLWIAFIALYLPPVQRYATGVLCREISNVSGYDVSIGSLHLAFPLKLNISDFSMSRDGIRYFDGEKAEINVSLLPLFSGEIEVNYVYLENVDIDTKEMIPDVAISGNIGYFRSTARNIDLGKRVADIRQVHLHSCSLEITVTDTIPDKDDDSSLEWSIRLRKGNIEESTIALHLAKQEINTTIEIGNLSLANGSIDTGNKRYRIGRTTLANSGIRYHKEGDTSPFGRLEATGIGLESNGFQFTPDSVLLAIDRLALNQPGGIDITEASTSLRADSSLLTVNNVSILSSNGSRITANGTLPWDAFILGSKSRISADLDARVNRKDLETILADGHHALSMLQDDMLYGNLKVNGNVTSLYIDTIDIKAPSTASIGARGYLMRLTDKERMTAILGLHGHTDNIGLLFNSTDSLAGEARIDGTLGYSNGIADADLLIAAIDGTATAKGTYDTGNGNYSADIRTNSIDLSLVKPEIPLRKLSAIVTAKGKGTDIFDRETAYDIQIALDTLLYDRTLVSDVTIAASQTECMSKVGITGNDSNLRFSLDSRTLLDSANIKNNTMLDIKKADWGKLKLIDGNLTTEMRLSVMLGTDLAETHSIKFSGKDMNLTTHEKTYTPADIYIEAATSPDSTHIHASNGDLHIAGEMSSGYNGLLKSLDKVGRMFINALQNDDMVHYTQDYERELPYISLDMECGRDNMLANLLAMKGITTTSMSLDVSMDSIEGLDISGGVYGLTRGNLNLDTIRVLTRQEGNRIRYIAGIRSTALNPDNIKESYNVALFGYLADDTLSTNFVFRDQNERIGIRVGATTKLKPRGIDLSFKPNAMLLGKQFSFNDGNYINIGKGFKTDADVVLSSTDGTGIHLYTTIDKESQDIANVELWGINLKELTGALPYLPDITGTLDLDLHFRQDWNGIQLSSDINAQDITYKGVYIGNEIIEATYSPKADGTHYIDMRLLHEEREIAHLSGNYDDNNKDSGLDGTISLTRFPLELSKAFINDTGVNLSGFINGKMSANGKLTRLTTNGRIQFESVDIDAYGFGTSLHMADETLNIEDNKLIFNNFNIYAKGDNPFKINGNIDFTRLADPTFSLRMNADNYELINSPRTQRTMFYGKLIVNTRAMIGGTLKNMRFYGDVTMLGKSNITYVMLDAPIESDKNLDGLVEFVNFNDTTTITAPANDIDLGNINLNLSLRIEDGARINADLDENRNNYFTTQGSGNLHVTYTGKAGLNVTGRYDMNGGEFKLSLPVIPLKTLQISDGSDISWTGPLLEPKLNITALERVTSSVTFDDNSMIPVPFDVGVKVSNTLSNMGLSFVMYSPENAKVQEQLNSLDAETMNRYAVTMLITGAYAGSSRSMTVANALNSFIDAKINDIAGTAMKSVNINVGINDATNAETGNTYKNYSFSFSKRFWNDRITFVIGGEVNSGDHNTGNDSFINNASLEWKLSDNSNRFLKLFYDKNYESILEGEITEMGIGYVYKRKLDRLKELFIFRKSIKETTLPYGSDTGNGKKTKDSE